MVELTIDTDKVAEIIKSKIEDSSNDQNKIIMLFQIAKELADNFEREDAKEFMERVGRPPLSINRKFNRKKFLKKCGVE